MQCSFELDSKHSYSILSTPGPFLWIFRVSNLPSVGSVNILMQLIYWHLSPKLLLVDEILYVSVFELIKFGGTISSHHNKIAISDSDSHNVSAYKCSPDTVLTVVVGVTDTSLHRPSYRKWGSVDKRQMRIRQGSIPEFRWTGRWDCCSDPSTLLSRCPWVGMQQMRTTWDLMLGHLKSHRRQHWVLASKHRNTFNVHIVYLW